MPYKVTTKTLWWEPYRIAGLAKYTLLQKQSNYEMSLRWASCRIDKYTTYLAFFIKAVHDVSY